MIRFLFRSIGFLAIAASFLLIIYDGTKSIAANAVFITTVRNLWDMINAASLASLRPLIETNLGRYAWDPAFTGFLNSPSCGFRSCPTRPAALAINATSASSRGFGRAFPAPGPTPR